MLMFKLNRHQNFLCNILWIFLLYHQLPNTTAQYDCINPNGSNGHCLPIRQCDKLMTIIRTNQLSGTKRDFMRKSLCKALNDDTEPPFVCCTEDVDFRQHERGIVWPAETGGMAVKSLKQKVDIEPSNDLTEMPEYEKGRVWGGELHKQPTTSHYWDRRPVENDKKYSCTNPNRKSGTCRSVYDCPSLLSVLETIQTAASPTQLQFIRQSQCTEGSGRFPFVCCTADQDYIRNTRTTTTPRPAVTQPTRRVVVSPSNGMGNVLPQPPNCGPISLSNKIYNGNDTALDQYPWMVLLEYVERSGRRILNCGGSLINQRYILTAAHCVTGQIEVEVGALSTVRLGEYDTSKEIDCFGNDCNQRVLELGIEEVVVHPQYNGASPDRHHDIALVRLNADVNYNDFIRPVCLPSTAARTRIANGESLTVAGWGRTLLARQSNIKQHLMVPVNDFQACQRKFKERTINLIDSQLCAGGLFAEDSCDGDSGGPLMRIGDNGRWYLEGVVSFGNRCGLEGWPGVYTRVASYNDWIRQNLRP